MGKENAWKASGTKSPQQHQKELEKPLRQRDNSRLTQISRRISQRISQFLSEKSGQSLYCCRAMIFSGQYTAGTVQNII